MPVYPPIPCRATKAVIQAAAEGYAARIGFVPGSDISEVVEGLGGRIVYRDFFLVRRAESIHVRAEDDFEIFVPHETSAARDRFTIGHELGHLLLHYPQLLRAHAGEEEVQMKADRYLPDGVSEDVKRCEWEANWFSAAFLMPSTAFIAAWRKASGNVEAIARQFLVSTSAAENRFKSLSSQGRL